MFALTADAVPALLMACVLKVRRSLRDLWIWQARVCFPFLLHAVPPGSRQLNCLARDYQLIRIRYDLPSLKPLIKSKELKTNISHTHSLVLSQTFAIPVTIVMWLGWRIPLLDHASSHSHHHSDSTPRPCLRTSHSTPAASAASGCYRHRSQFGCTTLVLSAPQSPPRSLQSPAAVPPPRSLQAVLQGC